MGLRYIYILLAGLLISCFASAQTPYFRQIIVNRENSQAGFNSLCLDTNRVMWLAGTEGLIRYNGVDYSVLTLKGVHKQDEVTYVYCDHKGVLWAGYRTGIVAVVTDSGLQSLPARMQPGEVITSIYADSKGVIWITTGGDGLYYYDSGRMNHISMNEDLADDYCYAVTEDKNGRLWVATDQGISWVERKGSIYKVTSQPLTRLLPDVIVRDVETDRNGNIWIAMQDSGICRYLASDGKLEYPEWSHNWNYGPVLDLYFNKNELWIGTERSGALYIEPGSGARPEKYLGYAEFNFGEVRQVISDPEENVWFGTENGLIRSHSKWLTFMNQAGNEKVKFIHSILASGTDDIYFTPDYGLLKLNSEGRVVRKYSHSLLKNMIDIVSMYEDECGYIWIGTMGAGLFRLNTVSGQMKRIDDPELNDASILSIDGRGDEVWLATFGGAYYLKLSGCMTDKPQVRVNKLDKEPTLGNFYIYTVFIDSRERVWFGTDKMGLTCFNKGRYYNYSMKQGLRSNTVYSITEDNKGAIWFSTPEEGICRFDGRTFKNYGKAEGLRELTITSLKYISFDRIVMVHRKGIDILHTSTGKIDYYGAESNLADINPDLNSITIDQKGRAWIGTEKGIVIYNPTLNINPAGPQVMISSVQLTGSSKNLIRSHEFRYNQNSFVFDFTAVWYTDPTRINYQYMLENYSKNWINTHDKQIVFPNLPPGKYELKVRASLSPSFNVSSVVSYSFRVRKPVWKENWFIVTSILLFVIVALIFIRNRDKRLKGIEALKKESVEYRFETLKSQVNPHFLFNSFNTLIAIIEKDKDIAIEYVEKLSDYFRNMIQYREMETILLRDEIEMVKTYYYLQKKRFGDYLILDVNLNSDLLNSSRVPPLSVQLLIENAIKHNAVSKDTPLKVELFKQDEKSITIRNNINIKLTPEISTGIGLQNIINRYKILTSEEVKIDFNKEYFSITIPLII